MQNHKLAILYTYELILLRKHRFEHEFERIFFVV